MDVDRARIAAALPHYDIGEMLGQGAHGAVFAARHRRLNVDRAVKVLLADDVNATDRFLTEARVMTVLDHPHIVRVHEYAERDGAWLLVMEYLPGGTLTGRGRCPPEQVAAWGLAVADALSAAHANGIVHRDIKPSNLLFTADGTLKVGDFGIAKLYAGADASASADLVGTPRYIAPEQILGGRVGPATDLYALGVTLYELLAGRPPYPRGLELPALIHHHLSVPPMPLDEPPARIAAVILHMLAKDPDDRPPSARACAVELARAASQDIGPNWLERAGVPLRVDGSVLREASEPATVVLRRPSPGRRRARWLLGAAGLLALLLVLVGGLVLRPDDDRGARTSDTATTATELDTYRGPPGFVTQFAFANHSSRVALLDDDGFVVLWTPGSQDTLGPIRIEGIIWDLTFDPSDTTLATAGSDAAVRFWNASSGKQNLAPITGLESEVGSVAFSRDGSVVAAADVSGIRLTNPGETRPFESMPVAAVTNHGLVYSPDGRRLASSSEAGVELWEVNTGALLRRLPGTTPSSGVVFSPDGSLLAAAVGEGRIQVWSVAEGIPVGPVIVVPNLSPGGAVAFDENSTHLVTCERTTVRWWDPTTARQVREPLILHTTAPPGASAFNRDATRLAISAGDGTVRLWSMD
ncbi:WD40 repeat domain-containing serine/threonine protein kinase [Cryptosporangium aurantiacum]|uniref:WD40 repeat domain-containing serine/threonine protein kinase n=1 Tax=Cryptosporangium aurantiacum TaxID=134849 RepID=UPI0011611BA5|nr:serine/threonine-protein kinase [Cryptosporangium aurantiacum]